MNERKFWEVIDNSLKAEVPIDSVKIALKEMGIAEILSFQYVLTQQLAKACSFPLLAANFVISSYVSDDGFREFRAWLISQGSDKYEKAVMDSETIADWLDSKDVEEIDGLPLLCVAQDAYVEAGGDESEFLRKAKFEPDPDLVQDWPESKSEYRARWPRLVATYWNDAKIREMHP